MAELLICRGAAQSSYIPPDKLFLAGLQALAEHEQPYPGRFEQPRSEVLLGASEGDHNELLDADLKINASWDTDIVLWGATSENVSGLLTEAEPYENLANSGDRMMPRKHLKSILLMSFILSPIQNALSHPSLIGPSPISPASLVSLARSPIHSQILLSTHPPHVNAQYFS